MLNLRSNWQDVNDDAMNETKNNVREYRFPLSIFPPVLQQLIIEANRTCNFPMSYMGASMLFALSTAIGNTCTLRVKRNRLERCILYLHLIGEPGSAKSHPLRFALQPILNRDIKSRKDYQKQYEQYNQELQAGGNPKKPVCRQHFVNDVTPEAMMKIMSENPSGVCILCDEVSIFHSNIGRYNKSGFDSTMLSLFDCQPIFIDRSGTDSKVTLDTPFGNFGGTAQPEVFVRIYKGRLTENGFLHRIMAVYNDGPDELPYDSELDIPSELQDEWERIINKILDLEEGFLEFGEAEYFLSDDAKAAYSSWSDRTTDSINTVEPRAMRAFFAKIKAYVYRLSLVLQVLYETFGNRSCRKQIDGDIMILATLMGEFMLESARKTLELFSVSAGSNQRAYNGIYDRLPAVFTKAQANEVAQVLGLSDSIVDKFCKDMQGQSIIRLGHGRYQKKVT